MERSVGQVTSILFEAKGIQILSYSPIELGDRPSNKVLDENGKSSSDKAICYTQLVGNCNVDDHVLLNTTATNLGLGTGGYDFVIAILDENTDNCSLDLPQQESLTTVLIDDITKTTSSTTAKNSRYQNLGSAGHIMKLRYTPLQNNVLCAEEPNSIFHDALKNLYRLGSTPVICCELHSQMPIVAAGIRSTYPNAKIVYCMTDQASLMCAHSNNVRNAIGSGLINLTITCGQALGGDIETVTLHNALLLASEILDADAIIVSIGPGIVGTDTRFGHGGIAQAEAINAVGALGGRAIAVVRMSFADKRERHFGLSHHFLTALEQLTLLPATICLPTSLDDDQRQIIEKQLSNTDIASKHEIVDVDFFIDKKSQTVLENITTMSRGYLDDLEFFNAAFCAGVYAGNCAK